MFATFARWFTPLAMLLTIPLAASAAGRELPRPTGPFAVGRVTLHLTDATRIEPLAPERGSRELMVDVWYPAEATGDREAAYIDPAAFAQPEHVRQLEYYFRGATAALAQGLVRTHAVQAAPFARGVERAPLLIFSHGGGEARETYTAQLEDLASHGYVVAAITHTYDSALALFPDGRRVPYAPSRWPRPATSTIEGLPPGQEPNRDQMRWWADDIRFVLTELTSESVTAGAPFAGRVDAARVGAFGHSAGGQAAALACQLDARIRACLNQDGLVARAPFYPDAFGWGMDQPFMAIARSTATTPPTNAELAQMSMTRAQAEALSAKLDARRDAALRNTGGGYWVELDPTAVSHSDFGDLPLLQALGDDDAETRARILEVVRAYTHAFFAATLDGTREPLLEQPPTNPFVRTVLRYPAGARPRAGR